MSYSLDFRKRALAVQEQEGLTYKETAQRFGVCVSTLMNWKNKRLEPKIRRERKSSKIDLEKLQEDVKKNPDAYQYKRALRFGVSQRGIGKALARLKISLKKKTLFHPRANEEKRRIFKEQIKSYREAGKPIVFIDESGFSKDMPRRKGYAKIGERCIGKADWNAKGRINVIGALLQNVLLTVLLIESSVNSEVFLAWVKQELLNHLPEKSVLVLDNASFHKRSDITQAIIEKGHIIEYLPPYSPDLNPIEHKWAQLKAIRKQKQCTVDELFM